MSAFEPFLQPGHKQETPPETPPETLPSKSEPKAVKEIVQDFIAFYFAALLWLGIIGAAMNWSFLAVFQFVTVVAMFITFILGVVVGVAIISAFSFAQRSVRPFFAAVSPIMSMKPGAITVQWT